MAQPAQHASPNFDFYRLRFTDHAGKARERMMQIKHVDTAEKALEWVRNNVHVIQTAGQMPRSFDGIEKLETSDEVQAARATRPPLPPGLERNVDGPPAADAAAPSGVNPPAPPPPSVPGLDAPAVLLIPPAANG